MTHPFSITAKEDTHEAQINFGQHRTDRLIQFLIEASHLYRDIYKDMDHIKDHKGTLEITWKMCMPNDFQKRACAQAWEMLNELEENIKHIQWAP